MVLSCMALTAPHAASTDPEGDISNSWRQCGWCEWCCFREKGENFLHKQEVLGHVLGPVCGEGNKMEQWWIAKTDLVQLMAQD